MAITANGAHVLAGTLTLPRTGLWHADLEIDSEDASKFASAITLALSESDLAFQGTAHRAGVFGGRVMVRMVAGAGGFGKPTDAKFYRALPARIPIQDVLQIAGERFSVQSDEAVLNTSLPFWMRPAGAIGSALIDLINALDVDWRALADGTIWVGRESWPVANVTNVVMTREDPDDGRVEFGSDRPSLLPGTTFLGRKVSRVVHHLGAENIFTEAWFE